MHHCIHTVGPMLGHGKYTWAEAVAKLAGAYRNVLSQFAHFAVSKAAAGPAPKATPVRLRLLPISGGIFAGEYQQQIAPLTLAALQAGIGLLTEEESNNGHTTSTRSLSTSKIAWLSELRLLRSIASCQWEGLPAFGGCPFRPKAPRAAAWKNGQLKVWTRSTTNRAPKSGVNRSTAGVSPAAALTKKRLASVNAASSERRGN